MSDTQIPMSDQAYEILRRKLVLCELLPGHWVSEADLQLHTSLPRTPTREATMRLVHENMLLVFPRRGYQVAEISNESAVMIFDAFEPLAGAAARRGGVNPDRARLDQARRFIVDGHRAESDAALRLALLNASEILLLTFLDAAKNPWLTDVTLRLFSHVERLWAFAFSDESIDQLIAGGFGPIFEYLDAPAEQKAEKFERFAEANTWVREHTLGAVRHHLLLLEMSGAEAG